jgi:hypothetical protein
MSEGARSFYKPITFARGSCFAKMHLMPHARNVPPVTAAVPAALPGRKPPARQRRSAGRFAMCKVGARQGDDDAPLPRAVRSEAKRKLVELV